MYTTLHSICADELYTLAHTYILTHVTFYAGGSPLALALYMESMMGHTSFQLKFSDFKTNLDCDTDSSSLEGSSQFPFLSIKLVDEICVLGIAPTELKVHTRKHTNRCTRVGGREV